MNRCIYLDIGNSNAKWKFEGKYYEVPTNKLNLDKLPESSKIWISNVSRFVIEERSNISIVESQKKYKSLVNSYREPKYLGSDRWLAMIASYEFSLGEGFIVVDIGSAVTIDLVDNAGFHQGGIIFPGLLKIRNTFEYFPVEKETYEQEIGQSTKEAWSIGTLDLIVNGINQKIHELKQKIPHTKVYLTGGGFEDIKKFIDFPYDYHKNLVLDGLELFVNNMG